MIRSKIIEKFEDFYEKTYFITRIFLKNLSQFLINDKFIKISFLSSKVFCFLKNLITRIKKYLNLSKNIPNKNKLNTLLSINYKKKFINSVDIIFLTELEFLSKSFNTSLRYTDRSKLNHSKNEIKWDYQRFLKRKLPLYHFQYCLSLKVDSLKFISLISRKKIIRLIF